MKKVSFDQKLKIAGLITVLFILTLIVVLFINLNSTPSDLEKREGVVSYVIEKNGMYNFKLKDDMLIYGKGLYINNDAVSKFIYKQISTFPDIYNQRYNIIQLNDVITFYIKKDESFEFKLSEKDNNLFPNLNDNIIIRRIANSEIRQAVILNINQKQVTNSQSDYIFSSQAKTILNIIYFLCIILFIIIAFLWILKATDKKNIEWENKKKQVEEKQYQDFLLLEKQLSTLKISDYANIPNNKLQDVIALADLYWITNKDTSEAEILYRKVLEQYPQNINALTMYGDFLFSQGRYLEADNIMEKAFELDMDVALLAETNYNSIKQKGKAKYWRKKYREKDNKI